MFGGWRGGGGQYFGRHQTQLYFVPLTNISDKNNFLLWQTNSVKMRQKCTIYLRVINKKDMFCPQIKLRAEHSCAIILAHRSLSLRVINKKDMFCPQIKLCAEHSCAIILAHRSLPAQIAMRIKFSPQIINHIWFRGFFSCSCRVSICAPNIWCTNKLARYK